MIFIYRGAGILWPIAVVIGLIAGAFISGVLDDPKGVDTKNHKPSRNSI